MCSVEMLLLAFERPHFVSARKPEARIKLDVLMSGPETANVHQLTLVRLTGVRLCLQYHAFRHALTTAYFLNDLRTL
jgi:hypothetical protein